MTTTTTTSSATPPPSATYIQDLKSGKKDVAQQTVVYRRLTAPIDVSVEPVGPAFTAYLQRKRDSRTLAQEMAFQRAKLAAGATNGAGQQGAMDEENGDIESEDESPALKALDPKDWKKQDHYAVLGLSKYRWAANDAQIKNAYRKKVLKHHPDKKAAQGNVNDDAFFKCVQKAWELLTDETRRKQFDSCDPEFDESIPDADDIDESEGEDFFQIFGDAFKRNAHFSKVQPVPLLGAADASREEIEAFYEFWYNFDSWRTFEYKDQDENEGADSRDDKRYVEKKNKAQRAKLKKEDNARLRTLTDTALRLDPRMLRIKKAEKEAKEAARKAKDQEKNKDKYAAIEAARRAKEEEAQNAEAAKVKAEEDKKNNKRNKELIRKAKKNIRGVVEKHDYFREDSGDLSAMEKVLENLETIFGKMDLNELETFKATLEAQDKAAAKKTYEASL